MNIRLGVPVRVTTAPGRIIPMIAQSDAFEWRGRMLVLISDPEDFAEHGDYAFKMSWPAEYVEVSP